MPKRTHSSATEWDSLPRQPGWRLTYCAMGRCCLTKKRTYAFWIQPWELAHSIQLYSRFLRQPESVQRPGMKLIFITAIRQMNYGVELGLIFISKILLRLQHQKIVMGSIFLFVTLPMYGITTLITVINGVCS